MTIKAYPLQWPAGWQQRPGFDYKVSLDGHIYRDVNGALKQMAEHVNGDGYLRVLVVIGANKRRSLCVHRAVALTFHGDTRAAGLVVRHLNGVKTDNRADNLAWGTVQENCFDAMKHGHVAKGLRNGAHTKPERRRIGVANGNSKLTPELAIAIYRDSRKQSAIAAEHGVAQTLVSHIKIGRIWNHATGLPKHVSGSAGKMSELNAARDAALKELSGGR